MNTDTKNENNQKPWASMGVLRKDLQDNGWRLVAERKGVARFERRDPRSETGAVTSHVEFNGAGRIASAWIDACRTLRSRDANKLDTILRWISESVPQEHHDAGTNGGKEVER